MNKSHPMHPHVNYGIKILRDSGKKILKHFDASTEHMTHSAHPFSPSPGIFLEDLNAKVHDSLERAYPDHMIIDAHQASYDLLQEHSDEDVWLYQTLCGFGNFSDNIPFFCMTLTHFSNGQAEHALVYDLLQDDLYHASKGYGAQLNSRRLRVQHKETPSLAFVSDSSALKIPFQLKKRMLGSRNLELAFVAANRGDLALYILEDSPVLAAGKLIAKEAGASVFIQPIENTSKQIFLCGNSEHLKKIMKR
jgi:myo-inositol-1(or 4)-monophosphatase